MAEWGACGVQLYVSIEVKMWVHGEPGACVVVTMSSLVRKDFIDGAGWMLGEHWWG